ncbi:hypothetical protein POREN0001_0054 [Porphyromonas endodontalis ATCC 35406]|uniref:Uncharacterized protein n=1 Tax=Porphyromonas endodontalis (strain ATCC 35406 / DSM 24491 / JCM 8526 / CCUG 16442 / BCRC 14492 / NCTC 13058 / HG 370) TaxID=553175 RepID=C3JD65_POREA|nr:hypothetical protein POREN0001_0054 [Porphyromonas endodontalis ATCC 35406]
MLLTAAATYGRENEKYNVSDRKICRKAILRARYQKALALTCS